MKKYWHIALMLLCVLMITSCGDDDDVIVDEVWKAQNETAFDMKKEDASYVEVKSPGNNGVLFMKQLKKGNEKRVFFTSRTEVYYKGSLINNTIFNQRLLYDGIPLKMAVSAEYANYNSSTDVGYRAPSIEGWTIALQQMCEGDVWEVWIPATLGYGDSSDNEEIPPYSTLIFEIEVVKVLHANEY